MSNGRHLAPRPGFVLDVDRNSPPIVFHHGEGFRLEKLPPGRSRVIYPAEPLEGLADPDGAIRHALDNPLGDSEPLSPPGDVHASSPACSSRSWLDVTPLSLPPAALPTQTRNWSGTLMSGKRSTTGSRNERRAYSPWGDLVG